MVAGLTFPFYSEARITFLPTYRYDVGVDVYDTSYVFQVIHAPPVTLLVSCSH